MPKSLNYKKRLEIIFLHLNSEGPKLPITKVAKRLKVSRHTVNRWVENFRKTGDVLDEPRVGRQRKTSDREDELIENIFEKKEPSSSKTVLPALRSLGINISHSTLRRRLKEKKFSYSQPAMKPSLTKKQREKRLKFARTNKDRDWSKVVFTDECTVRLTPMIHKLWRKRGKFVIRRRFKKYGKINIWGCFCASGFGKIILFTENLNAKKLIGIYNVGLLKSFPNISGGNMILQEDNDSKHTSKLAQLYRKYWRINRLEWPANSPDLNPIENVWGIMKRKIGKIHPTNLVQLRFMIRKVWYGFSRSFARNLVASMPERLKMVIKSKGEVIDY